MWPSSRGCINEGYTTKTTTTMLKYKTLSFKYLNFNYFGFYSDSEASIHSHGIFKIYGKLKFSVGYFLLDSVLMTECSTPDSSIENWSNLTNNHKGPTTISTILTTCLDWTTQYTLSPKNTFNGNKLVFIFCKKKNPKRRRMFINGVTIFQVVSFSVFQYEVGVVSNDMRSISDLVTVESKSCNMKRRDIHN